MAQMVKCLPTMRETWVQSLGWKYPLEKEMGTHSSILAWKIPWPEEPHRLQSMGLQRVGHDRVISLTFFANLKMCHTPSPSRLPPFSALWTSSLQMPFTWKASEQLPAHSQSISIDRHMWVSNKGKDSGCGLEQPRLIELSAVTDIFHIWAARGGSHNPLRAILYLKHGYCDWRTAF